MGIPEPHIQLNADGITINAVTWIDKTLRIRSFEDGEEEQFDIILVDTTHKLVDGMKVSVISGATPLDEVEVLSITVLCHEFKEVFAEEMTYTAEIVDPSLLHRNEDYSRIGAVKLVFKNSFLCS